MIGDWKKVKELEDQIVANCAPDLFKAYEIVDALYEEARYLGSVPRKDPKEGLEHICYLAKALKGIRVNTKEGLGEGECSET